MLLSCGFLISHPPAPLFFFWNPIGLVADPFFAAPFSDSDLRYELRVKPFLPISDPTCPEWQDIRTLVTLRPSAQAEAKETAEVLGASIQAQSRGIIALAEEKFKEAENEWLAFTKKGSMKANYLSAVRTGGKSMSN